AIPDVWYSRVAASMSSAAVRGCSPGVCRRNATGTAATDVETDGAMAVALSARPSLPLPAPPRDAPAAAFTARDARVGGYATRRAVVACPCGAVSGHLQSALTRFA